MDPTDLTPSFQNSEIYNSSLLSTELFDVEFIKKTIWIKTY